MHPSRECGLLPYMLDINFIRQNPQKVKEGAQKKGVKVDIDLFLEVDKKKRGLLQKIEALRAEQNKLSREEIERAQKVKSEIKGLEPQLEKAEKELSSLILQVPNMPLDEVPVGRDERDNVVLRKVGKLPKFAFKPKDYLQVAEELDLIDVKRAAKISGSRFGILKREAALLEFALVNFAFETLLKEKFIPVIPPVMLKEEAAQGTGYFEATDRDEAYFLPKDNLFLAGTSEQSIITMHEDDILEEKKLPMRYVGFSTCFRREAGSYGKDTKGIFRVHQFDKVEMVSFCKPEDSRKEHRFLLKIQEKLMKPLKIPYQVVEMCTAELGRPAAQKYDIEAWLPSENRYRETHSASNCTDFQARRLNIRYKDKSGKLNFVHTLNGTAFAIGRTLIMLIENLQQRDGSVSIPPVLQKYTKFKKTTLR
ncbi:MAG: seryl-tRNA synthetase [Parcubacteria group bacterium Gr01-1014_30]|nr:MAG: seryl-tRNA synthetase [Parcubacteria group bacterium Gr01-1014_30]